MNQWTTWLQSIPPEQIELLNEAIKEKISTNSLTISRINTEDAYIKDTPEYVDIYDLHPLYDSLLFERNLLLKGPKGIAKTLSIFNWASKNKIPVVVIECSEDTKSSALIGGFFIKNKETGFALGGIPTAIEIANEVGRCILLAEEFNATTPQIQKVFNASLDFRKEASCPQIGKVYRLRKGAKLGFVATENPTVYGGTYELNEDLKSRLEEIELGYPEFGEEKRILKTICKPALETIKQPTLLDSFIKLAQETRQKTSFRYSLYTRDLDGALTTVASIGLDKALQLLVCKFEEEDRNTIITRIGSIFENSPVLKKYWGAK